MATHDAVIRQCGFRGPNTDILSRVSIMWACPLRLVGVPISYITETREFNGFWHDTVAVKPPAAWIGDAMRCKLPKCQLPRNLTVTQIYVRLQCTNSRPVRTLRNDAGGQAARMHGMVKRVGLLITSSRRYYTLPPSNTAWNGRV